MPRLSLLFIFVGAGLTGAGGAVVGTSLPSNGHWGLVAFGVGIIFMAYAPLHTLRRRVEVLEGELAEIRGRAVPG
ncbi:MAG: hypothetical protein ACT4PU_11645 [Planctomycetota bacterium]